MVMDDFEALTLLSPADHVEAQPSPEIRRNRLADDAGVISGTALRERHVRLPPPADRARIDDCRLRRRFSQ